MHNQPLHVLPCEVLKFVAGSVIECMPHSYTSRLHMECFEFHVSSHVVDQNDKVFTPEMASPTYWRKQYAESNRVWLAGHRYKKFEAKRIREEDVYRGWIIAFPKFQPMCNDNSSSHKTVLVKVQKEQFAIAKATLSKNSFYSLSHR